MKQNLFRVIINEDKERKPITSISSIAYRLSFIRGDHPEYGVLTQIVFAKDKQAAIEHTIHCYGEGTVFVKE